LATGKSYRRQIDFYPRESEMLWLWSGIYTHSRLATGMFLALPAEAHRNDDMTTKPDAAHIEREIGHNQAVTLGQQIARLEDQLATERLNNDAQAKAYLRRINELREQLAAERKKVAEVEDHNIRGVLHPEALAKRIAEAQQPLVDALNKLKPYMGRQDSVGYNIQEQIIDNALEKVKDQPVQLPMINDDPVVTLK
jgi:hypothetical protein